jgi:hypothetical protein
MGYLVDIVVAGARIQGNYCEFNAPPPAGRGPLSRRGEGPPAALCRHDLGDTPAYGSTVGHTCRIML